MGFKIPQKKSASASSPLDLYEALTDIGKGPGPIWLHQGRILESWHRDFAKAKDVAIELPTGAGKTLVGSLVAEFQRQQGDRVAYLCPTRQLARQTHEKLRSYGIPSVLLTKKSRDWSDADRAKYSAAQAIAVSTYSHVFNSNPGINDANLLVMDDAHAASGYVAGPWSLEILRGQGAGPYFDLLNALPDAFTPAVLARLQSGHVEDLYRSEVYLAAPSKVIEHSGRLEQVLLQASSANTLSDDAKYALRLLRGHLGACMIYFSHGRVQIRPLISPTENHLPFSGPTRRIYMSATLGSGGELERVFGRRKIKRIPVPEGWEKRGTGRRLITFPSLTNDLAGDSEALATWVQQAVATHGRTVLIAPDTPTAKLAATTFIPESSTRYSATDVEDDLSIFTNDPKGVLVLANRYDGIDLPDEKCRLVVLVGLPAKGDLQERFLHGSVQAVDVLQERIRARIMQGMGRATRNSRDYSSVIMMGTDLVPYVSRDDVQAAMHPEVHAELVLGYENSIDVGSEDIAENFRIFLEHGEEWDAAEEYLREARSNYVRTEAPGTHELQEAVPFEIAASEAMWASDWQAALGYARNALDALGSGRGPQRYAGFWSYLAASIAEHLALEADEEPAFVESSRQYFQAAKNASRGTLWRGHLLAPSFKSRLGNEEPDALDAAAISGLRVQAEALESGSVFPPLIEQTRRALMETPHKLYEEALVTLGKLLGASESYGDGGAQAAPDSTWVFQDELWICWEAKSEASPTSELSVDYVRQSNHHLKYIAAKRDSAEPPGSLAVVLTPQASVHPTAAQLAQDFLYRLRPAEALDLFERAVGAWDQCRARGFSSMTDGELLACFTRAKALPSQWLPQVSRIRIMDIPTVKVEEK